VQLICTLFSHPSTIIVRTPKFKLNRCPVRDAENQSKKSAPSFFQIALPHFATTKKGKAVDVLFERIESVLTHQSKVMYSSLVRRNHFKTKEQLWQR